MDDAIGPTTGEEEIGGLLPILEELALVGEADAREVLLAITEGGRNAPADRFVAELARRGLLTPFQAGVLARGRGRDLRVGNDVLQRPIGSGGMGKVDLAPHRTLRRPAAIKVVDSAFAREPAIVRRFQREVEAMARLDHPNLVAAFDAGEVRGPPSVVMEYVDGPDLGRVVKNGGPMGIPEAVAAAIQAARGLQAAHERGIVHRDVTPHNLLRAHLGTVKVSDLGLARLVADAGASGEDLHLTRFGAVIGTVFFLSPEQARDSREADERSDVYSLGCTLFALLTGKMPDPGKAAIDVVVAHRTAPVPSARGIRPEVSPELDAICRRMMAKLPEDRPQSMAEVIEALGSCPLDPKGEEDRAVAGLVLDDEPGLIATGDAQGRGDPDPLDGSPRFALLLLGDRPPSPFDFDPDLDAIAFPPLLDRRRAAGLRPASLSAFSLDGRERTFALWIRP
ncbi:serine/threonine-protein kinase [Tautonia sociabilis]|uniref:serine/threonine-protein kinase n=1 Tax=Tautonia sociabilis TaxID=2080755 RepID=UPI001315A2B5|nr:serine/threonine-protein kinase [Tautonia sociabilis]